MIQRSPSSQMQKFWRSPAMQAVLVCLFPFLLALFLALLIDRPPMPSAINPEQLLTDPFLQLPTQDSVRVVWFTEFAGTEHQVWYGDRLQHHQKATSRPLTRLREDAKSPIANPPATPTFRTVWRHEALIPGLTPDQRVPYQVRSLRETGEWIQSDRFSLSPAPSPGRGLKILLTSDHQLMPMTAANLEKVVETLGAVDGVFLAGDLVNIPDRGSEWFDSAKGNAFFPCLQGRAGFAIAQAAGGEKVYRGGQIIQNAPLFPALGNHEVMGRFSQTLTLSDQFSDPYPRPQAAEFFPVPGGDRTLDPGLQAAWLKAHSFNSDTYEEIFTLPQNSPGGKRYYAVSFGDIRLISLYVTNIWRVPTVEDGRVSRYREPQATAADPSQWSYGQHIFEPITPGTAQYEWLKAELASPEFQQAKYKIVMFHHPAHTLGGNIVPAYTDPQAVIERDGTGAITAVRYEYPLDQDYIHKYLEPLWEQAGVQLVYYGHSHLWNRFRNTAGVNFLESSNVGNTYGAYWNGTEPRFVPPGYQETYVPLGDPYGLEPIMPTLAPLVDEQSNQPLPYIASNSLTVFSILDTATGNVTSYRFDTTMGESEAIAFDQFSLLP
ncbi:metallophosphoesterase family protein [Spirulina sp. CCNP1310]|uniref:metallophosphoesterase family protein n=1 Tax=Spirulina sp. CCNP1310 TaxID=3110249 RepID=UPI002B1F2DAD|nr:metallophosphoesterase family protein [Spirulina sp. CCNP1310]